MNENPTITNRYQMQILKKHQLKPEILGHWVELLHCWILLSKWCFCSLSLLATWFDKYIKASWELAHLPKYRKYLDYSIQHSSIYPSYGGLSWSKVLLEKWYQERSANLRKCCNVNWEEVLEKSFPKRDLVCKFCRENSDKVEHMTGIFSSWKYLFGTSCSG